MTKLEELNEAYKAAIDRNHKYQAESRNFAERLHKEFCDFLGCQPTQVLSRPEKNAEEGKRYHLFDAMELEDDGFWHVGLVLMLAPAFRFLFHPMFKKKKEGESWVVKIAPEGRDIPVRSESSADFRTVAEEMFASVKTYLDSSLDRFLAQDLSPRETGFIRPQDRKLK